MINLKEMMTPVHQTIKETDCIESAIQLMNETKWDIVPVTNSKGKLVGVFTRSHLFSAILAKKPLTTQIKNYIKKDPVSASLNTSYETVKKLVKESNVGTGVVVNEKNEPVGLLTKTGMVMALLRSAKTLQEQLEAVLQSSHLGIVMTDEKKEIIYANDHFANMLQENKEKLLGNSLQKVLPHMDTETTTFFPKIAVGEHQSMARLSSYEMVNGERGYIAVFHEITELELLAKELETVKHLKKTIETAIDFAYDGILMVDAQSHVTMVSPSLLELFQLKKSDVINKKVDEVMPQLNLCTVFQSEEVELSDFLEVNGIKYIVNKIPIIEDGKLIGALAKVMYRQLNQVNELYKKLELANKSEMLVTHSQTRTEATYTWDDIITQDEQMERIMRSGRKAAKGKSTILLLGESGTGKELFAHAIHNSSMRKNKRFVTVNCAAIPEQLLESEFFGYEEGAFTGAKSKGKMGKFELADGGTLFLDEIGDMSLTLQGKLLRVLQEGEFYRVGGTDQIKVDVRIIAATNRSLEKLVEEGKFREDLYYRLHVIALKIPALRERQQDIPLLINTFMKEFNRTLQTSITGMEKKALESLLVYRWPGNIRELKNVMERAMIFAESGKIKLADLPECVSQITVNTGESVVIRLAERSERATIERALRLANGNKTKAAKILGISRSGLYEKLKRHHL